VQNFTQKIVLQDKALNYSSSLSVKLEVFHKEDHFIFIRFGDLFDKGMIRRVLFRGKLTSFAGEVSHIEDFIVVLYYFCIIGAKRVGRKSHQKWNKRVAAIARIQNFGCSRCFLSQIHCIFALTWRYSHLPLFATF
jgi:hypothetical protein